MLGLALRQEAAYREQRLACHRSYDAAHKAERRAYYVRRDRWLRQGITVDV
jgi:hypothetical protein